MLFTKLSSLWSEQKGAMTIYATVVLIPLLLLQGVLLDYVRIKYTEMNAEKTAKAVGRSVLSAFDRELRQYGLFGLLPDASRQKQMIHRVLGYYQESGQQSGLMPDRSTYNATITPVYSLADHQVLHQQIIEEMKLKGPITFTLQFFNVWGGREEQLESERDALIHAERIERLLQERERELEDVFALAAQLHAVVQQYYTDYEQAIAAGDGGALLSRSDGDLAEVQQQASRIKSAIVSINVTEKELAHTIGVFTAAWDQPEMDTERVWLLDAGYLQQYEQQVDFIVSLFASFVGKLRQQPEMERADLLYASNAYANQTTQWFVELQAERSSRQAAAARLSAVKENKRGEIKQSLRRVEEETNKQTCTEDDALSYNRLRELEHSYRMHNAVLVNNWTYPEAALAQTADEYQRQALSVISRVAQIAENIRDEVFVNEYALHFFSHRLALRDERRLSGQEVEYMLYGMYSCSANRNAAYAEIFMLRFGIRMVEQLVEARKAAIGTAVSPLAYFLIAAAEGAALALQDMDSLLQGDSIAVFEPIDNLKLDYAGYLRLLLALHASPSATLSRIQSLIGLQTGTALTERPTYVEVRLRAKVRLWFFPGAARLLQRHKEGDGQLWQVDHKAVAAY